MDNGDYVPSEILRKLKEAISETNCIMYRWIKINKSNPKKMSTQDVEAIFYGYIRKLIFKNNHCDFKKAKHLIHLTINDDFYITNILVGNMDVYYIRELHIYESIETCSSKINYFDLMPMDEEAYLTRAKLNTESVLKTDNYKVDYSKLEQIKF